MPRNLVEQIQKAVELAAGHSIEINALCLRNSDVDLLACARIDPRKLGVTIAVDDQSESALRGTFRGTPIAIVLSDFPVVERVADR